MHAAFLKDRKMRVKIGNVLSNLKSVTGGAVQGSVLGVMDHNAMLEFINDDVDQDMYKYIDDLTLKEAISRDVPYLIDSSGDRDRHTFKAENTQKSFDVLSEKCALTNLKINDKKTQLLSILSAKNTNTAWLKSKEGTNIYSGNKLKLLGFVFNEKPNVHAQVENLIEKAAGRSFVLRHLSSINCDISKLRNVYCSIVSSVLEYSGVVYGLMLTKYQSDRLENIQKRCLRSIYGYKHDYETLLQESGLRTLEERRELATIKCAQKAAVRAQRLINLEIPVLVRSLKSSNVELG